MLVKLLFWSATMRNGDRGVTCNSRHLLKYTQSTRSSIHADSQHALNQPPGLSWRPSVCSNMAMGIPTFLDRPATTTFFPIVGIPDGWKITGMEVNPQGQAERRPLPVRLMISQTPQGVAGSMVDWSRHMRPTLTTWKPSTSLVGETALQTVRSSMWSARE